MNGTYGKTKRGALWYGRCELCGHWYNSPFRRVRFCSVRCAQAWDVARAGAERDQTTAPARRGDADTLPTLEDRL